MDQTRRRRCFKDAKRHISLRGQAQNDVGDKTYEVFKSLTQESSLSVYGEVVENDRAPGGYELIVSSLG